MRRTFLVFALAALIVNGLNAQPTVDTLKFAVVTNNGSTYSVKVQIKSTSAPGAGLGTATFQFTFNKTNLSYPTSPTVNVDYVFQNFSGGSYVSDVTQPLAGVVSVNISYNGAAGAGTPVSTSFVDVATIVFTTTVPSGSSNLVWNLVEVLTDDNLNIWNNNALVPLNTIPLPVELASFSAAAGPGIQAVLTWTTVSEKNNYGFEVQKSLDAKTNYQTIPNSFIKGHGTTLVSHSYSYTVANPGSGNWYYRLKQVDLDGTTTYTVGIQAGGSVKPVPKEFALDQNYPNPFNPTTTISYAMPKDGRVTMEVFNVIGQRVALLVDEYKEAGYHTVPFDAHALASGIYFYRFVTPEVHLLKKMMVLK